MEVKGVMFLINKESINIYVLNVLFRSSPTQRSIHVDNEAVWNHCHHSASSALKVCVCVWGGGGGGGGAITMLPPIICVVSEYNNLTLFNHLNIKINI